MPDHTDLIGFVSLQHMLALAILMGKDSDGRGAQLSGGPEGAHGDLTTVRDKDLAKHGGASGKDWTSGVKPASA